MQVEVGVKGSRPRLEAVLGVPPTLVWSPERGSPFILFASSHQCQGGACCLACPLPWPDMGCDPRFPSHRGSQWEPARSPLPPWS